ncbi:MAG: DUF1492 domain-containing protein [Lachnospiraceae bacterium]|nr:DUF1492 domain-containing protein [Lachnospiraceae bacterium]
MTSKEYLRQAHNLDALINSHLKEKSELQQMAFSISTPNLGERVQTSRNTDAPYTKTIEKISLLEDRITREIDRLVDLKAEMLSAIEDMENADERLLLKYRYFDDCSFEQISSILHISLSTVYRLHSAALKNFVVPMKVDSV